MKEVSEAIYAEFTGTALASAVDDLYISFAQEEAKEPYIVFDFISGLPQYQFDTRHEELLVQFNIYSEDNSSVEINNLYDLLKNVFDDCSLTLVGYRHVNMQRELNFLQRDIDEGIWHYVIQYRILIEAL